MVEPEIRYRRPGFSPGLVVGAVIMGLGVILLLDQFGVIDARDVFHFFWPLVLILAGVARILHCETSSGRTWGGILVFAGLLWGVHELNYPWFQFSRIWPLILIAIGAMLVWRALEGQNPHRFGPKVSPSLLKQWAIFGGGEFSSNTRQFQGGEVLALFGGCKIDLRGAEIEGREAAIEAVALFGGVELHVPDTWNVNLRGMPILGGFVDSTRHPRDGDSAKQLVVKGVAMFGGVEVKN